MEKKERKGGEEGEKRWRGRREKVEKKERKGGEEGERKERGKELAIFA